MTMSGVVVGREVKASLMGNSRSPWVPINQVRLNQSELATLYQHHPYSARSHGRRSCWSALIQLSSNLLIDSTGLLWFRDVPSCSMTFQCHSLLGSEILTPFRTCPDSGRSDQFPLGTCHGLLVSFHGLRRLRTPVVLRRFILSRHMSFSYVYLCLYLCARTTCSLRPGLRFLHMLLLMFVPPVFPRVLFPHVAYFLVFRLVPPHSCIFLLGLRLYKT